MKFRKFSGVTNFQNSFEKVPLSNAQIMVRQSCSINPFYATGFFL